ncbi:MAG: DNA cytosine methyltransferase [Pelosinus sp.]|nr:DNA cytosine methyltransferase [Pelosinus sp.]
MMINYPIIFSFFSGAGFLDLGFQMSGYRIGLVNEIYPPFMESYQYSRKLLNLPDPIYGYHQDDVAILTKGENKQLLANFIIDARKTRNLIGFIGGPPCPDFSVGGKNRGREGNNGKLSDVYIKLICQQKPDFFVFENVKGLWRTKKHRAYFEEMKKKLNNAGYITTERLINAMEYGVPQDRERIILIGFQKSIVKNKSIKSINNMLPEGIFPWGSYVKYPIEMISKCPWPTIDTFVEDGTMACPNNIPKELTVQYWFELNNVMKHPNAKHCFVPRAGLARFKTIDEGDVSKKSYKRLHRWRYSPTACYGNNEVHIHPYKARRISVAEALAIQSLPKEFALPPEIMTLSNMFKTVGNGVPYIAAKAIAQTILDFLEGKREDKSPNVI